MRKALFVKLSFFFALIGLDALTKAVALAWIPPLHGSHYPFGGIQVFENVLGVNFSLNTIANTGIAWGFFPDHLYLLLAVRLAIVFALLAYLLFSTLGRLAGFSLWMIAAGALGNIIDMFVYGHVIDFIHLQFFGWSFPIFNLADSCITIGALLLFFWPKVCRKQGRA